MKLHESNLDGLSKRQSTHPTMLAVNMIEGVRVHIIFGSCASNSTGGRS